MFTFVLSLLVVGAATVVVVWLALAPVMRQHPAAGEEIAMPPDDAGRGGQVGFPRVAAASGGAAPVPTARTGSTAPGSPGGPTTPTVHATPTATRDAGASDASVADAPARDAGGRVAADRVAGSPPEGEERRDGPRGEEPAEPEERDQEEEPEPTTEPEDGGGRFPAPAELWQRARHWVAVIQARRIDRRSARRRAKRPRVATLDPTELTEPVVVRVPAPRVRLGFWHRLGSLLALLGLVSALGVIVAAAVGATMVALVLTLSTSIG